MSKKQTVGDKAMKGIVAKMVKTKDGDWPPFCAVFTYQPKRPMRQENGVAQIGEKANDNAEKL